MKKFKSTKFGPNQCPCGVQYTDRDDLKNHIEKVHSPEHWTCSYPECPKFYNTRGSIWRHYRVKHLKAFNWQCPEVNCDWGHEEESALKKNMVKDHAGESKIMSPQCKHVFSQGNKLKQHMEICQNKKKPHPCPEIDCIKAYKSKASLRRHIANDHADVDEPGCREICEFGGKEYKSKQSLRIHKIEKPL